MKLDGQGVAYMALAAGVLFIGWKVYGAVTQTGASAAEAVKDVVTKDLNPASADNIVHRAVTSAGAAVTGDDSWTLGTWIYDKLHPAAATSIAATAANQDKYNRPAPTTNATDQPDPAPLSFYLPGASYKDLADGYSVNPWGATGAALLLPAP